MNLKEFGGKLLKKGLPLLGGAILGPGGAGLMTMVAGAIGSDTEDPDKLMAAIEANPEAIVSLKKCEMENKTALEALRVDQVKAELAAETSRIESVNATMRIEATADKWWVSGWRPFWGFTSGAAFFIVVVFCCYLTYLAVLGGRPELLAVIPQVITAYVGLFAIPGTILGVTAWHRGKKQRIQAGEILMKKIALPTGEPPPG